MSTTIVCLLAAICVAGTTSLGQAQPNLKKLMPAVDKEFHVGDIQEYKSRRGEERSRSVENHAQPPKIRAPSKVHAEWLYYPPGPVSQRDIQARLRVCVKATGKRRRSLPVASQYELDS